MKAVRYTEIGTEPVVAEVPTPEPGPGQVLLRVSAAGMCPFDLAMLDLPAAEFPFALPLTLGHEAAGEVASVGTGVRGVSEGEQVAVYGPWGCGHCLRCARGQENYCTRAGELGIHPPGLGAPGAMAEYLLVDDSRQMVPLDGVDPIQAAVLTDAGLSSYHAIKRSLPKLLGGTTAVVLGIGGLGQLGVPLLRAMTPATVVALDIDRAELERADQLGAHHTLISDNEAVSRVRELTKGAGAEVVLDFVGEEPTMRIARECVAVAGDLTIVGLTRNTVPVGFASLPFEVSVAAPYWGTRADLIELLALARNGMVSARVTTFEIDQGREVCERFRRGGITGRPVILPNG